MPHDKNKGLKFKKTDEYIFTNTGRNRFYRQLSVPMDKKAVIFTEEQNIIDMMN